MGCTGSRAREDTEYYPSDEILTTVIKPGSKYHPSAPEPPPKRRHGTDPSSPERESSVSSSSASSPSSSSSLIRRDSRTSSLRTQSSFSCLSPAVPPPPESVSLTSVDSSQSSPARSTTTSPSTKSTPTSSTSSSSGKSTPISSSSSSSASASSPSASSAASSSVSARSSISSPSSSSSSSSSASPSSSMQVTRTHILTVQGGGAEDTSNLDPAAIESLLRLAGTPSTSSSSSTTTRTVIFQQTITREPSPVTEIVTNETPPAQEKVITPSSFFPTASPSATPSQQQRLLKPTMRGSPSRGSPSPTPLGGGTPTMSPHRLGQTMRERRESLRERRESLLAREQKGMKMQSYEDPTGAISTPGSRSRTAYDWETTDPARGARLQRRGSDGQIVVATPVFKDRALSFGVKFTPIQQQRKKTLLFKPGLEEESDGLYSPWLASKSIGKPAREVKQGILKPWLNSSALKYDSRLQTRKNDRLQKMIQGANLFMIDDRHCKPHRRFFHVSEDGTELFIDLDKTDSSHRIGIDRALATVVRIRYGPFWDWMVARNPHLDHYPPWLTFTIEFAPEQEDIALPELIGVACGSESELDTWLTGIAELSPMSKLTAFPLGRILWTRLKLKLETGPVEPEFTPSPLSPPSATTHS